MCKINVALHFHLQQQLKIRKLSDFMGMNRIAYKIDT